MSITRSISVAQIDNRFKAREKAVICLLLVPLASRKFIIGSKRDRRPLFKRTYEASEGTKELRSKRGRRR